MAAALYRSFIDKLIPPSDLLEQHQGKNNLKTLLLDG
jgi:hypothetical protein